MNTSLRLVGVLAVALALGGAAYAAFSVFDQDAEYASIQLDGSSQAPVTLLDGGSTPFSLEATNQGSANETVNVTATSDGFTFTTEGVTVEPNETTTIPGTLSVEKGHVGNQTVEFAAERADGGDRLGSTTVDVRVLESEGVLLTLESSMPAVIPGSEITLQGTVQNPVGTAQTLNFTLGGAQGTVEPASTEVGPNGSTTVTVTAQVPDGASDSITMTLTAENQAGDQATGAATLPVLAEGEIAAGAVHNDLGIDPGESYAVPVIVVSNQASSAEVSATGETVVEASFATAEPRSSAGGFVTLQMPEGASEASTETVTVTVGDASETLELRVDPSPPGEEAEDGKQVEVEYVGRMADGGGVFDTSRIPVAEGNFEKADQFQARGNLQPLEIPLNPQRPGVVQGFYSALVNMSENESRTVTLSPDEAYGPPRTHQNLSATTDLDRNQTVEREINDIPTQQLPPEFNISEKEEGDEIVYTTEQGGETITFRFELTRKGEDTVDLYRLADVGETTTFYPPWPNATEVAETNETHIVYQTTPPSETGNFTWDVNPNGHQAKWENATTVDTVNETTILLRHSPEEGLVYNASTGPRSPPSAFTVESVGDEEIHVSTPNDHPLAGETLIFDITMLDVSEFQQRGPMIGGGGPG